MFVDDELSMRNLLKRILSDHGYEYCSTADGEEAAALFERENPDLLILDVMMPDKGGLEICKALRDGGVIIPIILLTAKGDIVDKEAGFNVGADDYMVKPFNPQELVLRIEAHLKRNERIAPKQQEDFVTVGDFEFDIKRCRVSRGNRRCDFTPKEFQILLLLANHEGEVFTREQLIEAVWGEEFVGETSSLPVFIRRIREKIETEPSRPKHLQTAWRSGYRFVR